MALHTSPLGTFAGCAKKYDCGLLKFLNRFKIMVMMSTSLVRRGPEPYGNWDHRVFYKKFAHGYPPLSQPDVVKRGALDYRVWYVYPS